MFYSATTGGFYSHEIHSEIPSDVVEVSDEQYSALFVAQATGKMIAADKSGFPVAVDPPPLSDEELLAGARARQALLLERASGMIAPLQDAVDLDIATPAERASLSAWKAYRVAVNRVPGQAGFPRGVEWPAEPA